MSSIENLIAELTQGLGPIAQASLLGALAQEATARVHNIRGHHAIPQARLVNGHAFVCVGDLLIKVVEEPSVYGGHYTYRATQAKVGDSWITLRDDLPKFQRVLNCAQHAHSRLVEAPETETESL